MFDKVIKEELRVPARNESLKDLRDFIARIGRKHRFSDKVINSFKLAIDEASTNIIRHAYREKTGDITIRAIIRKESFTISLIDQGRFFDPTSVKDPDLKRYVAIGKKGGLGIFMIRKLVDDISYHRTDEGNELRMTKTKDLKRKRRLAVPKVPGSMRVKYYTFSAAIVSTIVLVTYFYNFVYTDNEILQAAYSRMDSLVRLFAQNSEAGLLDDSPFMALAKVPKTVVQQDSDFVNTAIVTDTANVVQGTNNLEMIPLFTSLNRGDIEKQVGDDIWIVRKKLREPAGADSVQRYFLIQKSVQTPGQGTVIGSVYLYVPAQPIFNSISQKRTEDLKIAGLILLLANLGIGLLIFLIFTPLQKLSNWIRDMGQTDIRDQIDIDTSNEIGKIAQAFGEITDKFRESQKSLADQERIQQEMQLAKEIQQTLLPAEFPNIKGYEIASHYEAAKEVGGDYYDFVEVDRDRMGVVVADVSGKGVPGSLVMTMIRTALRTEARGLGSAAEVLSKVNDFVIGDIKKGMFVTLFYAILDSRRRRVTFASAGHNPMILYRAQTQKTYYLNPKGFPVGISLHENDLFKKSIEDDTIQLAKGDIIICYTDGITEAMNSRRELFGEERLLEVIRQYGHLRAKNFVAKLKEELVSFTEGQVQYDDITFVVIKEKMNPEESEFDRASQIYYDILNNKTITEACEAHGMPSSTFSQKYKVKFEEVGVDEFKKEFETTSVEARHLSIEELTKIYDIIRNNPQWGAKRISDQLNTEEYGFSIIPENRIYEELVRKRLNTRSLREAYLRRGSNKKRMKPPGTPMLTLDGKVIMDDQLGPKLSAPVIEPPEPKPEIKAEEKPAPKDKKSRWPDEEKRSIEEKEGAELILSDIVELLDKSKDAKEEDEVAGIEEIEDDFLPAAIAEEEQTEAEEIEDEVEYDGAIKKLFAEAEIAEETEDIDFSDLSEIEYSEDLFDDRTNGGNNEPEEISVEQEDKKEEGKINSTEQDEDSGNGKTKKESKRKSAIEIFDALSVKVEDEAEIGVGLGEFEDLVAIDELAAADIKQESVAAKPDQSEKLEKESEPELQEGSVEIVKNPEQKLAEEQKTKQVKEILEELSREIEEETEAAVYDSSEPADNLAGFFDLVSGDEIIQDELDLSDRSEEKSVEEVDLKKKRSEKVKINNQQRLLIAGGHFYLQKKYDKAIDIFQRIIIKYPNNIEAYYNLGNSYFRMQKYDDAQIAYEKVCELDPTFLDAMENLGVIFANKQQYKEAIRIWKKILEFDPKREDIKKNIEKALRISRKK